MNTTCQVTHHGPGRIRLHLPNTATQPEAYHRLVQFVLSLPEVTRVELEPATESVTLIHSRAPHACDTILQTLRATAAQTSAPESEARPPVPPLPGTPAHMRAPESNTLPSVPAPRPARSPYADGAVVHAMRGRVRMRIPVLQADGALAGILAHFLKQQPGVREVRLSRLSGGIAIAYDTAVTDAKTLARLVGHYQPDAASIANWQASQVARRPRQRQQTRMFQISLALAVAALALNFVGAPGLVVFVLLLAAIWGVLRRASQRLLMQRQFSLELLAVAALLLLWVTGRTSQAAVFVIALATSEWLRSSPYRGLDNALASGLDRLKAFSESVRPVAAPPRPVVTVTSSRPTLPANGADPLALLVAPAVAATVGVTPDPSPRKSIAV